MNPPSPKSDRSLFRRTARFALITGGLCLAPFVILALVALSYLGLRGDVAVLREQIFAATPAGWSTKMQFNVGASTLGATSLGLRFARNEDIARAGDLIAAAKRASVGIYERKAGLEKWSRTELFARADEKMNERGWSRLVGVADGKSTVLVYAPAIGANEPSIEICVAVIDDRQMVISSAKVDTNALSEWIRVNGLGHLRGRHSFLAQN